MYEEYITEIRPVAAAVGRRVPYHLEYLRRYGDVVPLAENCIGQGKEGADMETNYMSAINEFWDSVTAEPLPTGQVSLYMALLHICSKSNWIEWFHVSNQVIALLAGLSDSGILKARQGLEQRGLIEFREQDTKSGLYRICTIGS